MEIARQYPNVEGNDDHVTLIDAIEDEMSGGLATLCALMILPMADRFAYLLHKAMAGLGTSNKAIIHILGFQSKALTDEMADRYDDLYGISLEQNLDEDLGNYFEGNLKAALLNWICGDTLGLEDMPDQPATIGLDDLIKYFKLRDSLAACVRYLSILDAQQIREACKGWGTDEDKLIGILSSRTHDHLQRVNTIYVDRCAFALFALFR